MPMKKTTLIRIAAGVLLLIAAVLAVSLLTPRSWKSGGTTVTLSRDGTTFRVRASWGITVSYEWGKFFEFYGLKSISKVRGRGAMKDYVRIAPPWRTRDDSINDLIIEEGVTYIGQGAFAHEFLALTSITIPNSVTEIGAEAFWDCINLTTITIPDGVTTIGEFALPGPHGDNDFYWSRNGGLHCITSLNPVPPKMDVQLVCVETNIYVPEGSVEAYRSAEGWNKFKNIKPINSEACDTSLFERRECRCQGIGWCGSGEDGYFCGRDREKDEAQAREKSGWVVYLTSILMICGFAFWMYALSVFILKKIRRREGKKTKILLMTLVSVFTVLILFFWGELWYFLAPENDGTLWEYTHLPSYDHRGAVIFGGVYLAVTALFYLLFRKKIKRRVTKVILLAIHIIIFALLFIGGGL